MNFAHEHRFMQLVMVLQQSKLINIDAKNN